MIDPGKIGRFLGGDMPKLTKPSMVKGPLLTSLEKLVLVNQDSLLN